MGRPLELLLLLEDCQITCGICVPPAEGGGSGIARAPVWGKLELNSRRGASGKLTQVCVPSDAEAGQQVTQK